jgi:hypothetical protein
MGTDCCRGAAVRFDIEDDLTATLPADFTGIENELLNKSTPNGIQRSFISLSPRGSLGRVFRFGRLEVAI